MRKKKFSKNQFLIIILLAVIVIGLAFTYSRLPIGFFDGLAPITIARVLPATAKVGEPFTVKLQMTVTTATEANPFTLSLVADTINGPAYIDNSSFSPSSTTIWDESKTASWLLKKTGNMEYFYTVVPYGAGTITFSGGWVSTDGAEGRVTGADSVGVTE